MKEDYEKQLAEQIHRELNSLPELHSPPFLAARILHAIKCQSDTPWYRRSWQTWSLTLRTVSMTLLGLLFTGAFLTLWKFTAGTGGQAIKLFLSQWIIGTEALWRTAELLSKIASGVLQQLAPGALTAMSAFGFLAAVLCIGLGTTCYRLAMKPSTQPIDQ